MLLFLFFLFLLSLKFVQSFHPKCHAPLRVSILINGKTPTSTTDKIRVRLLQPVEGQGKKGDTVMVSKTMWLNVLSPKKLAVPITEEQIAQEIKLAEEGLAKLTQTVKGLQNSMNSLNIIKVTRKIGSTGQMFGSITKKNIIEILLENLHTKYPELQMDPKTDIKDINVEGNKETEIKKAGVYNVSIKLQLDIIANFKLEVVKE